MKIGLVCPYNVAKGGGVQEIVYAMQAELQRRGHQAYIITPKPQDHNGKPPRDGIIFVGNGTDFKSPTRTTIQVSGGVNEEIYNMLEAQKFDVLHFHEPWIPMFGYQIISRSNTANVATFHAKLPETLTGRTVARVVTPYTKPMLKYMHALTAVSDAAADYVCTLTDQPVAIVPNAVEERFKPPKTHKENKRKTIFYVGRLEGRKGLKYLLRALRMLTDRHPDVSLVVGGDGPDREKLELLATDLELSNVTFKGYVSDQDKLKLLQTSDLFCAPSLYGESFGLVLLEAMGCGLPLVAGDNPGYAGVLTDLGALSLVDPKDTPEFARRLELLLYQPELRTLWRQWAASQMPQYTYQHVIDQYLEVYKAAIHAQKQQAKA